MGQYAHFKREAPVNCQNLEKRQNFKIWGIRKKKPKSETK